jgi:hypothetical protein
MKSSKSLFDDWWDQNAAKKKCEIPKTEKRQGYCKRQYREADGRRLEAGSEEWMEEHE